MSLEEYIWKGPEAPEIYHPNLPLGQLLLHKLKKSGSKVTQVCGDSGVEVTCDEMVKLMTNVAHNLMSLGLKSEDVVGIVAKNTTHLAPAVLGCLLVGAQVNPLDPTFIAQDITQMYQQTKPKLVFCDHDNVERVQSAIDTMKSSAKVILLTNKVPGYSHISELMTEPKVFHKIPQTVSDSSKECIAILCSSGTTGNSKGVRLSHAQCINIMNSESFFEDSFMLCFSSLYWISGFLTLLRMTSNGGKRLITSKPFNAELQVEMIEKFGITNVLSSPNNVALMINSPKWKEANLSSIKYYMVGGSFTSESVRYELQQKLSGSVIVGYGMTEVGGAISLVIEGEKVSKTVGKLTTNVEIKIVDDNGDSVRENVNGEICIRTSYDFLGYVGDEQATNEVLDADNWVHSGDLGYMDEEENLYIIDRKKFIIKYMNYQISPSEIENLIEKIPGIETVCVIGIPDLVAGDLPAAFVTKTPQSNVTEQYILNLCERELTDFKKLRGGVHFVDEIPLTPSGKVQKMKLLQMVLKQK
ncbi:unnamed protein product [Diamesa hyperborea]